MHKLDGAEKLQTVLLRFIPVVFPHLTENTLKVNTALQRKQHWLLCHGKICLYLKKKQTLGHLETMICYREETTLKLLAYAEKELKQSQSTTNLEDLSLYCKCIRNVKASQTKVVFQHQTIWQDQVFFSGWFVSTVLKLCHELLWLFCNSHFMYKTVQLRMLVKRIVYICCSNGQIRSAYVFQLFLTFIKIAADRRLHLSNIYWSLSLI